MKAGLALALVAMVLAGCSRGRDAPLPAEAATLAVTMEEYRFGFDRDQAIDPGRVVFEVTNRDQRDHELLLVALPADLAGTLNDQLRSPTRRPVLPLANLPPRRPGQSGSFAVDLAPGRYGLMCFLQDPDGQRHALKGMNAELRVR